MKATGQLHKGFSGAIGDLIFRQYNGKTVVSRRPVYMNESNTEGRRKLRDRFREATEYAVQAMEDRKLKSYYQQKAKQLKLPNPYTAAITDYLRKAKVRAITSSSFAGKKGNFIRITFSKAFSISGVTARVFDNAGTVLFEQSLAPEKKEGIFRLTFPDDFPDWAGVSMITEEPAKHSYTIMAGGITSL